MSRHELHFSGALPFFLSSKAQVPMISEGKGQPSVRRGGQNVSNYSFPLKELLNLRKLAKTGWLSRKQILPSEFCLECRGFHRKCFQKKLDDRKKQFKHQGISHRDKGKEGRKEDGGRVRKNLRSWGLRIRIAGFKVKRKERLCNVTSMLKWVLGRTERTQLR